MKLNNKIKVLTFHTRYRIPGGEDRVFEDESALLEKNGHEVLRVETSNESLRKNGLQNAVSTFWNQSIYRDLQNQVKSFRPDVVHIHNDFPLASPAVFHAARATGAAVVHTLHNYRSLCVNGLMYRDGNVCTECLERGSSSPGLKHGCYRDSKCATGVVTARQWAHKLLSTWDKTVDRMIAPSRFLLEKHLQAGVAPNRITLKPHFVPGNPTPGDGKGGYALFVGRLMEDKGLDTLLDAWRQHPGKQRLKIVGAGPMEERVTDAASSDPRIEYVGQCSPERVGQLMADASCTVAPSPVFESFGRVAIESLAHATPAIVTNHGAMAELIDDGQTGWLVPPNDAECLTQVLGFALSDRADSVEMRERCHQSYLENYTEQRNYEELSMIYRRAIGSSRLSRRAAS